MTTNSIKSYSDYSAIVTYSIGDVVLYLNNMYVCKLSSLNNLPTNATYWNPYASNPTKNNANVTNISKS